MTVLAKELGLILPEGHSDPSSFEGSKTFGMYKFSDGTVCLVLNDPSLDQNLVAIDPHLGKPAPAELDLGRIAAFSTYQAPLQLENFRY